LERSTAITRGIEFGAVRSQRSYVMHREHVSLVGKRRAVSWGNCFL
jgi:hypothetical protein